MEKVQKLKEMVLSCSMLLIVLLMGVGMTSCSDDEEDVVLEEITDSDIIGAWSCGDPNDYCQYFVFKHDHTGRFIEAEDNDIDEDAFTWSLTSDGAIIVKIENLTYLWTIEALSQNYLTLNSAGERMIFERISESDVPEAGGNGQGSGNTGIYADSPILGSWSGDVDEVQTTLTFNADGTATETAFGRTSKGTFELSGSNLRLDFNNSVLVNSFGSRFIVTVSSTRLTLKNDLNQTVVLKKV